jgi:hypothetical protein
MSVLTLLNEVAATDRTVHRADQDRVYECPIGGGSMRIDARTGAGATIARILRLNLGGANAQRTLGVAHGRRNGEAGRRWHAPARRRRDQERFADLVGRLRIERARRWRDVPT